MDLGGPLVLGHRIAIIALFFQRIAQVAVGKGTAVVQSHRQPRCLHGLPGLSQVGIDFGQVRVAFGVAGIEVGGAQAGAQRFLELGLVDAGIPVQGHAQGRQRLALSGRQRR